MSETIRTLCVVWCVMAASMGCKTGDSPKATEDPVEEANVLTQEITMVEKAERIPPGERTFKDDMLIVCYSPMRIDETAEGEARTRMMSDYISNNIYTPEALEFFQDMSTMDVTTRDVFFEKKVNDLGLVTCPFLEETRQHNELDPLPDQDLTVPVDTTIVSPTDDAEDVETPLTP